MSKDSKEKNELNELKRLENASSADDIREHNKKMKLNKTTPNQSSEDDYDPNLKDKNIPLGFVKLDVKDLPSKGMFYPADLMINIRAAQAKEIRHWSTIDESDPIDVNDHLNEIIKSCVRVRTQNSFSSKDILEIDRLFLILAIRDLTMKEHENQIVIPIENPKNGEKYNVELKNNNLDVGELEEKYLKFYNEDTRRFEITINKTGEKFIITPPALGITEKVTAYIKEVNSQGGYIDKTFIKVFPYICQDWRTLTTEKIKEEQKKSNTWSPITVSVLTGFVEGIELGVKPHVSHKFEDGAEVTAPIQFPRGIKSLFLVQDIFEAIS